MSRPEKNFDKTNALVALGVWLIAMVVYWMTKAPTLSLWDCGEFIAACVTLGVPHPPGTPLYVIIGRVFSLLPLSEDVGVRVNVLSGVASSFTAMFGYLATVRILRACFGNDGSNISKLIVYGGGTAAAFILAFSLTNWNNSVEAEVYGLSMMMLIATVWLALIYRENMGTALGERVMLLMVFIVIAGIGVHMTTLLALPAVGLLFIIKKDAPRQVWYAVGAFVIFELYLMFAMSSRPDEIPYYIPIVIAFVFYLFYIFSYEKIPTLYLIVAGGFLVSVLPLMGLAMTAIRGGNIASSTAIFSGIGKVCFGALILFALFMLYRYNRKAAPDESRQHYLIASIFVLVAGLMTLILVVDFKGYHGFLIVTGGLSLVFVFSLRRFLNWPVLIATVAICMVILGVKEFVIGLLAGAILIPVVGLIFKLNGWKNALLILLVAILGYSVHVYIPLRSAQQPIMNENNPSQNLTATINYIERKQYGSQSMIERMFKRRSEWQNQFGNYRRMGFWHFFQQQYGMDGVRFVPILIIGLYGLWEVLRRRSEYGTPLLILLLLASVGLILYMNFADGTRQDPVSGGDYIEVRDRDYFFTPAFILFAMVIAIGLASVVQFIRESMGKSIAGGRKAVVYVSLAVFLFPVYTLAQNYHYADRAGNYIAFDYAWNLLVSADENAVLFTAGDNDTFPVWCLQQAYHIREDVDVINLSLANARWYIKQVKNTLGVHLRWSDADIDSLFVFRDQNGYVHRLQDQVVAEVINSNWDRRPVNFAVTVSPGARTFMGRSIDSVMVLKGLVRRIDTGTVVGNVDVEESIDIFTNPEKMRYRSIADPNVYKTETGLRLTRNYLQSFIEVADTLVRSQDYERAIWLMKKGAEYIPHGEEAVNYVAALYAELGRKDDLLAMIENPGPVDKRRLQTLLGRMERRLGNNQEAEKIYNDILAESPSYRYALEELVRFYYENRQLESMRQVLRNWVTNNPEDQEIANLLKGIDEQIRKIDSLKDSTS